MQNRGFGSILTRMGSKRAVLAGILCLLASAASADIVRLSPTSFPLGGEDFLYIYGTTLAGNVSTQVVFDGTLTVEASNASEGLVIVFVPVSLLLEAGEHSVEVQSIDDTGTRTHGPASFTVVAPEPSGPPSVFVPEAVSAEAESAAGAYVSFAVTAISANGDPLTATCSRVSGSLFSLGATTVTCSATDASGTGTASFVLLVTDTTPPQVTVPANIVSVDPVVTFAATAVDSVDGPVNVTCSPSSGSAFPSGTTLVTCTATDAHFNPAIGSFSVRVTGGPPELVLPEDFSVEATSAAGTVVTYQATAVDGTPVSCLPASGSTFVIDTTLVTCSATNTVGSASGTFSVTVYDRVGPVLTVPSGIATQTTSPAGIAVTFVATAHDFIDGDVPVTCTPASGSVFPIGVTTVVCVSGDTHQNLSASYFDVTVNLVEGDTTPPVLTLPGTITREATLPGGATVSFVATAFDDVDGDRPVTCTPASGSLFALGTTTVACSASDTSSNTTSGSFLVVVQDTTAPVLTLPSQVTAEATSPSGAVVTYVTSATDIVDGDRPVGCAPPSGSVFPLGTTTVGCSSSDTRGNTAIGSFDVIVEDTTPPEITRIVASPGSLWPPNHKMVGVTVEVTAVDTADPAVVSHIVSVSSNQPINGTGDGDTAPDWNITGPLTVQLRAERAGSNERIYTITVEATDASGNTATATVLVRVAASKSRAVR